jgi:integrase
MKVDVFKRKQCYLNWKERVQEEGIPELSQANSDLVIQFVLDMETGQNIAKGSAKGGRSYPRLCNLVQRMTWIARMLEKRGISDLGLCDEKSAFTLFSEMERGVLLSRYKKPYKSFGDYAKVFKAFWHWWMKVNRKQGHIILDITEDIRTNGAQAQFVYISKQRLEEMLPYFSVDEQVVLFFLFDSMIRSPTEVLSLNASHIYEQEGEVWVTIPEEISKTFERTLNLLYSGQAVREYMSRKKLGADDFLFSFKPSMLNKKMQKVAVQLFGNARSHAKGDYFSKVTLYDLRHSGAVHFRLLAKENPGSISLDAVRHRGGWADMKMLNYYTQFLGLDGMIKKQGMMLSRDKHRLEQEVDSLKQELETIRKMNAKIIHWAQQGEIDFPAVRPRPLKSVESI